MKAFVKNVFLETLLLITIAVKTVYSLELTILHTNDVHSRIEQSNRYNGKCDSEDAMANRCYGGVARRYTKIKEIRGQIPNVLLLDAGDQFQGTLWFSTFGGTAASHFMKRLRYDVMVLGNHEFDNGVSGLIPFMENVTSSFPVISANIDATGEPALAKLLVKSVVRTVEDEKVAIVGYTLTSTPYRVDPSGVKNVIFKDEISALQEEVARIQSQGINKIIALGHSGIEKDIEIAKHVKGVDIVVGGHSNTFLYSGGQPDIEPPMTGYPIVLTQDDGSTVLVVTAYAYGKYLGYLNVTFDEGGSITSWDGNPVLLDGSIKQDPKILAEIDDMKRPIDELRHRVIGTTAVHLDGERSRCRREECNMGNLVTDAIVYSHLRPTFGSWAQGSAAIWNAGGVRSSIEQGNVTMGDVLQVLPFRNEVNLVTLNGTTVRNILEHSALHLPDTSGGFLQLSGIHVSYDIGAEPGSRVRHVQIRCASCTTPRFYDLEEHSLYRIFVNTFLLGGGDNYGMIKDGAIKIENIGTLASEALEKYVSQNGQIFTGDEARIKLEIYDKTSCSTSSDSNQYLTNSLS